MKWEIWIIMMVKELFFRFNTVHCILIIIFFLDSESSSEEEESNSSSTQGHKKNLRRGTRKFYKELTDEQFFESLDKEDPVLKIGEAEAARKDANAAKELKTMKAGM